MADDAALEPLAPGELIGIGNGALEVRIAPAAGGRIAQVTSEGVDWLCGFAADNAAAIAWGCYPMLPWAGRIRGGRFRFDGHELRLPPNLGAHAIHGVGFTRPWLVDSLSATQVDLSLRLPRDASWPFGGLARHRIAVTDNALRMELSLTADQGAMPRPVLGWHPWFRKPARLEFTRGSRYARDAEGIATLPLVPAGPGPWDDCFIHSGPIFLHRADQALQLSSDCDHWVVYDERSHATCVEPQSGPPDAFNLQPAQRLEAGEAVSAWFAFKWLRRPQGS